MGSCKAPSLTGDPEPLGCRLLLLNAMRIGCVRGVADRGNWRETAHDVAVIAHLPSVVRIWTLLAQRSRNELFGSTDAGQVGRIP
jgi:hypothetical protein